MTIGVTVVITMLGTGRIQQSSGFTDAIGSVSLLFMAPDGEGHAGIEDDESKQDQDTDAA